MCGIAGAWVLDGRGADDPAGMAAAMIDRLRHRGPDDVGVWADPGAGIALSNRRLAIIDLSPAGHQPMVSADGRYVLAYNGEAYNFPRIRQRLEALGHGFRSHSDTEVLLEAAARWGLTAALREVTGMFALALWDRQERTLHLARDRFGEKPLYWTLRGGTLLFGSELKALRASGRFDAGIDQAALCAFLELSFVPAPLTIHRGVHQLEPGCIATIRADGSVAMERFWDLDVLARDCMGRGAGQGATLDALEVALRTAVSARMVADVPLGVFLSGGIDSSLVAAYMRQGTTGRVRSFSIGFEDARFDESPAAAEVARHLDLDHTALTVTETDALRVARELPDIYDEPFADSSQIPTVLLARLARRHVTVALTGDGGDEAFGGYSRHVWAGRLDRMSRWLPPPLLRAGGAALGAVPPGAWRGLERLVPGAPRQLDRKAGRFASALRMAGTPDFYRAILSRWPDPGALLAGAVSCRTDRAPAITGLSGFDRFRLSDARSYLPDGVLVKVDRATMAASLESRAPFLDPAIFAMAWSMGEGRLVEAGKGKQVLRSLLARHLPASLVDRPKSGFSVPLAAWLRGPLKDWAAAHLDARALADAGLNAAPVLKAWSGHLAGRVDAAEPLWTILAYMAWRQRWG